MNQARLKRNLGALASMVGEVDCGVPEIGQAAGGALGRH